ncbi:MAG TPA: serine hydrolase domain-containing protein, partial [Mycobacteriales bacterium]|nr:serine hydrolase domain-containing protein [Mycobacteriales bacterium]
GIPGVSALVRDENGTWRGVAGTGDIRAGTRPDPAGEFRVGSITKTFTATMILQLVAEHRLDLEAPIGRYLPDLLPYQQSITIHQLLQHRSGLVDYANIQPSVLWPTPRDLDTRRFRSYSPRQLVGIATAHPLLFTPGTRFSYSNTNYIVLGMLIEKITHQSYPVELLQRILLPAGLHHTFYAATPYLPDPAERGYESLQGPAGPLTDLTAYDMSWADSAGAIISTSADLNRFYRELLTGRLLPAAQLAQMKSTVPTSPLDSYGLGLIGAEACGSTVWGHDGSVPGYRTFSFSTADGSRQITVSVNRSLTASTQASAAINTLLATEFCGSAPAAKAGPQLAH